MSEISVGRPHLVHRSDLGMLLIHSHPGDESHSKPFVLPSIHTQYGGVIYQDFGTRAKLALEERAGEKGVPYSVALGSFMAEVLEQTIALLEKPPENSLENPRAFLEMASQGPRRVYAMYGSDSAGRAELGTIVTEYATKMQDISLDRKITPLVAKIAAQLSKALFKVVEKQERADAGEPVYLNPERWDIDL